VGLVGDKRGATQVLNALLVAVIIVGAIAAFSYFSYTNPGTQPIINTTFSSTSQTTSTAETQNTATDDPLLDPPGSPTLYHETCASTSSVCKTTMSTVGVPQVFNMSSVTDVNGSVAATTYEQLFGFQSSANSTIHFAFRTTEPGWVPASGYVYYDGSSGFNFSDLQGEISSGQAQEISNSGTPNAPAGQFPVDSFSGQIAASPGAYIFDFQKGGGGTAYFLVRDVTAAQSGITVTVGQPQITSVSFSGGACGGGPGSTGPRKRSSRSLSPQTRPRTSICPRRTRRSGCGWASFHPNSKTSGRRVRTP